MSALGQSLPIRSAPVPNNVRYASNSDRILRRSEMTPCANRGHRATYSITSSARASSVASPAFAFARPR